MVDSEWFYIRLRIGCLLLINYITRIEDLCFFKIEKKDSIVSVFSSDSHYAVTAVRVPAEKCIDGRHKGSTADCPWDRKLSTFLCPLNGIPVSLSGSSYGKEMFVWGSRTSTSVLLNFLTAIVENLISFRLNVTVIRSVSSKNCERAISYLRRSKSTDCISTGEADGESCSIWSYTLKEARI